MIPPITHRCAQCGHTDWSRQFTVVSPAGGPRRLECPACGFRFEPVDDSRLN